MVVSRCGMPLGYEVFADNTSDLTTVEHIVEPMENAMERETTLVNTTPQFHDGFARFAALVFQDLELSCTDLSIPVSPQRSRTCLLRTWCQT